MIEAQKSFEDAARIAAPPTVDGLFMGPYDLSLARGRGQYQASEADRKDDEHIAIAATSAKKLLGMPAFQQSDFAFARKHRAHVITIADDISVLVEGLKAKRETHIST